MLNIGLDIGGANTKMVISRHTPGKTGANAIKIVDAQSRYFPFWERYSAFPDFLKALLADRLLEPHRMAVTTTAELADCFSNKGEGVKFVLSAVENLDPTALVILNSGKIVDVQRGLSSPERVAAANWAAPSMLLSRILTECIFVDAGSTTTDIIPISKGRNVIEDPTDRGRLKNHQLVYTGALRTNVATIVDHVVVKGEAIGIASENFATMADVNLMLGFISRKDYSVPTSDGGDVSLEGARRRLSRIICSDPESVSTKDALEMARFIHGAQVSKVSKHAKCILSEHGYSSDVPCVIGGVGRFALAKPAVQEAGLTNIHVFHELVQKHLGISFGSKGEPGDEISSHVPAASLALLLSSGRAQCGSSK